MMRPGRLYLRVGALLIVGAGLLIGFVLFLTAGRINSDAGLLFETYLRESVQGLDVGSSVRYRGVAVGRVTEIGLVSAEYLRERDSPFSPAYQLVMVRFAVDPRRIGRVPDLQEAIDNGLRTRIASQGLTGVSYIELDFVDEARRVPPPRLPWTPVGAFIPSVPSTITQVTSAAENLIARLNALDVEGLLNNINGLVGDLRGQVMTGDLAQALRDASTLLRTLRETVTGADINQTLGELRAAAGGVRDAAGTVQATFSGPDIRNALARLPAVMQSLEATVRAARVATTDTQADLGPILRDLRATAANLRDTTEMLRRSPSQAIFGAPPPPPERR
ncbi:MlaD family protein [Plastoroseomonas hellenica]|uniref:MlaD family protein n=1 Tax=Plastoroseomonas hellenica TaxID=2687306 RepID=UPI001BAC264D|nr:MlaD family protein [Plastoroseomonas hellenica]MBR0647363.1 MCE family protein [Plastoroseomonas hellenica]